MCENTFFLSFFFGRQVYFLNAMKAANLNFGNFMFGYRIIENINYF